MGNEPGFLSELKIAKHYYNVPMGLVGPVMVDIHPTLACQNRCYYCISANTHVATLDRPNFSRSHQLDLETISKLAWELKDMHVKSVQLTGGGEPTLHPEFEKMLCILSHNQKVGLFTNGVLLKKYAETISATCDWARVSLDASNADMYKRIKGTDYFQDVIDGINAVKAMRLEFGFPRIKRFGVSYILTPESYKGIEEIGKLLAYSGIDYLQFKDVVQRGMILTEDFHQSIEEQINRLKIWLDLEKINMPVLYTKHLGHTVVQELKECLATDYVAVIGADGNVYSCCHLEYLPECSYGSIYAESLQEIWANRKRMKINPEYCWNCRFAQINHVLEALNDIKDEDFL